MSADATVVAGEAFNAAGERRAVLWSGNGWQRKTDLGTLKSNNSGDSWIAALSADGTVAGGEAVNDAGEGRAVLWSGNGWQRKTDLGTLKSNNSGRSWVNALSADGRVAGGEAVNDAGEERAVLWYGSGWQTKTDLGTLKSDNSGDSWVGVLNADGKVAGGGAHNDAGEERAVLWSGSGWQTKTELGTLKSDNSGDAWLTALSADGRVAGGGAHNDAGEERAVLWSGSGWQKTTDLGTLKSNNSGDSWVNTLSADGAIAAGWAHNDAGEEHAVLWTGSGWQSKTDLGTLASNNSGESAVQALNADGSVAIGYAENDAGEARATLWKIRYSNKSEGTTSPVTPVTPTPPIVVGKPVDADNTRSVLHRLGGDTLEAADMQRAALARVREQCGTRQQGEVCYRIQGDAAYVDDARDAAATLTLGYGFSDRFSAGASVSRSFNRRLGETYRSDNPNNHALGLFAQYRVPFTGGEWFVRPSVAWNSYKVHAVRPVLPNTEAGEGEHRLKAASAGLQFGQNFMQDNGGEWGWYSGIEHSRIKRNGYTETNADFPVTFGQLSYRDTALLLGASAEIPLGNQFGLQLRADTAYSLDTEKPKYTAYADYIGRFEHEGEVSRARGTVSAGVSYRFNPHISAFVTPYVGRTIGGNTLRGASFGLKGTF